MARMRRFRATSSGHKLITDTSLLCAQRNGLEPIVFRRQVRVRVLAQDCSTERPLPADVRAAQPGKLYVRAAAHAGCMCAASGPFGQRTAAAASQVQPFRVRLVLRNTSPASLDAFVRRECGSSSTMCSSSGGATVEVPNGTHKPRGTVAAAREIHAAAAHDTMSDAMMRATP